MNKIWKIHKKLHRWLGLILILFILNFAISGIILNHRNVFGQASLPQSILPANYHYHNWNRSALSGIKELSDSTILYGEMGIYQFDKKSGQIEPLLIPGEMNSEKCKIYDLEILESGEWLAATGDGLISYYNGKWRSQLIPFNKGDRHKVVSIEMVDNHPLAMTRSGIYTGEGVGDERIWRSSGLLPPEGEASGRSFFHLFSAVHSGKIFGLPGRLFVDLLAVIFALLAVSGLVHFFFPRLIKRSKSNKRHFLRRTFKFASKQHIYGGIVVIVFLLILTVSGMFLRPPFLIAIIDKEMSSQKTSVQSNGHFWKDKLRKMTVMGEGWLLISTSRGFYMVDQDFQYPPFKMKDEPPFSIMGVSFLNQLDSRRVLVGSFSGIYFWDLISGEIRDHVTGRFSREKKGRPVGQWMITGYHETLDGLEYMIDYRKGLIPLGHDRKWFTMPEEVHKNSRISLWNLALEMHTGRILSFILGDFYILIVPITGLMIIIMMLNGLGSALIRIKKKRTKRTKAE